jgi:hypothetical protein
VPPWRVAGQFYFTLFKKKIAVYSENHMKPTNTLCVQITELLIIKVGGTHSYHWALKV